MYTSGFTKNCGLFWCPEIPGERERRVVKSFFQECGRILYVSYSSERCGEGVREGGREKREGGRRRQEEKEKKGGEKRKE